jgi:hypothetical protein
VPHAFIAEILGVPLKECILPLSNTPLCLAPLLLESRKVLAVEV